MKFKLNIRYRKLSDEALLDDIRRVAKKLRKNIVTHREYMRYGKFCGATIYNRFGSWNNSVIKAGLETSANRRMSTEELHDNMKEVWVKLGKQPTCMEMKRPLSKFSYNAYKSRFGSWCNALEAFEKFIREPKKKQVYKQAPDGGKVKQICIKPKRRHRTNRRVTYYMRYKILCRDNHACRSCGRSPASERGVKLHIDHIKPWSKGGETTIDNLQVLCEACNFGKGST